MDISILYFIFSSPIDNLTLRPQKNNGIIWAILWRHNDGITYEISWRHSDNTTYERRLYRLEPDHCITWTQEE